VSAEANEAVVRRFVDEFLIAGDSSVLGELVAPEFTFHVAGIAGLAPDLTPGREAWLRRRATLHAAFPDLRVTIEDLMTAADKVVVRYRGQGTHTGFLAGIGPTQKAVSYTGIMILRCQEGRIIEEWSEADLLGLLSQVGAISMVGATRS
jgi:predicted ester cyclase